MAEPSLNWAFVMCGEQKTASQKNVMEKPADKKSVL